MAPSSEASRRFAGEFDTVFDAVCRAARAEQMKVRHADPATGIVAVSSDMTAFSWGENADIRVWRIDESDGGGIGVAVESKLKFGLVDWGKNKRNIDKLFARVDHVLADPAAYPDPVPPGPPPAGWHADPTRRHQSRYWDGAAWTEHVADAGVTGVDPV
jgi:hypothetical protein